MRKNRKPRGRKIHAPSLGAVVLHRNGVIM